MFYQFHNEVIVDSSTQGSLVWFIFFVFNLIWFNFDLPDIISG